MGSKMAITINKRKNMSVSSVDIVDRINRDSNLHLQHTAFIDKAVLIFGDKVAGFASTYKMNYYDCINREYTYTLDSCLALPKQEALIITASYCIQTYHRVANVYDRMQELINIKGVDFIGADGWTQSNLKGTSLVSWVGCVMSDFIDYSIGQGDDDPSKNCKVLDNYAYEGVFCRIKEDAINIKHIKLLGDINSVILGVLLNGMRDNNHYSDIFVAAQWAANNELDNFFKVVK